MRRTIAVLLFALVATSAFAADVAEEDGVYVLNSGNFDEFVNSNEYVLAEFYAPWCGHCKRLAPEYAKAAQVLRNENSAVKLAKIDATAEGALAGRFEVRGYPTLKFFINGQAIAYEGGRTEGEILSWLRKKTQPSTRHIDSVEEFETLIKNNDVVVLFFGGVAHPKYSVFEVVSRGFDDVIFVHSTHDEIKTKYDVDHDDVVTLFKRFDEGVVDFEGDLTSESLTNFIKDHQFPTVMGFDQKVAQKIFSDTQPALFLLIQNDEAGQRAAEAFRTIATKLKGKLHLSLSNIDEGLGSRLAEFVGVSREQLPAVRIIRPAQGAAPAKFLLEEEITPENIYEFVEAYLSGRLRAYLKSEPIPETQEGPVTVLVGNNFRDIVINSDDDVLVEFYAPWCGHCKALAPQYDEAARQLSHVKNLVIAKVDATANEVEGVHIQGYPTLKFYPAGKKNSPVDYDGERNAEGIVAWLKEHAKGARWVEATPDEL